MSFGKSILEKYGWKDGDGLGKEKQGIEKPIKATLKFDNTGLGHDRGAEFTNHWWQQVYNDASNNVNVTKNTNDNITINTIKDETVKEKMLNDNKLKYGTFLNSALLNNEGKEIEKDNPKTLTSSENVTKVKILTDEELLKACGGRTAHKAARHGINLSGKLARIAEQEAIIIENMNKEKLINEANESSSKWILVKKTKKRKLIKFEQNSEEKHPEEESDILDNLIDNHTDYIKPYSNNRKKLKKKIENKLSEKLMNFSINTEEENTTDNNNKEIEIKRILNELKKEYKVLKQKNNLDSIKNMKKNLKLLKKMDSKDHHHVIKKYVIIYKNSKKKLQLNSETENEKALREKMEIKTKKKQKHVAV